MSTLFKKFRLSEDSSNHPQYIFRRSTEQDATVAHWDSFLGLAPWQAAGKYFLSASGNFEKENVHEGA